MCPTSLRFPQRRLVCLLPSVCLSGQWDSCVLCLDWSLPWGSYRGRPKSVSHWPLCQESRAQNLAEAHSPMSSQTTLGHDGHIMLWLAELRGTPGDPFLSQPRASTYPSSFPFHLPCWGLGYSSLPWLSRKLVLGECRAHSPHHKQVYPFGSTGFCDHSGQTALQRVVLVAAYSVSSDHSALVLGVFPFYPYPREPARLA